MTATALVVTLVCLTGGAIVLWILASLRFSKGVESPKYSVLDVRSGYEIRKYDPYVVARTDMFGSYTTSSKRGFEIIANYFYGNNVSARSIIAKEASLVGSLEIRNEKIPMTTPVLSEKVTETEMQGK
jgi:hypothetical protein